MPPKKADFTHSIGKNQCFERIRTMIDEIYNSRQGAIKTYHFSDEWEQTVIPFEESLTEEQIIMFHKLCDLQSETAAAEMRAAYKAGFKDGVSLMREVHE